MLVDDSRHEELVQTCVLQLFPAHVQQLEGVHGFGILRQQIADLGVIDHPRGVQVGDVIPVLVPGRDILVDERLAVGTRQKHLEREMRSAFVSEQESVRSSSRSDIQPFAKEVFIVHHPQRSIDVFLVDPFFTGQFLYLFLCIHQINLEPCLLLCLFTDDKAILGFQLLNLIPSHDKLLIQGFNGLWGERESLDKVARTKYRETNTSAAFFLSPEALSLALCSSYSRKTAFALISDASFMKLNISKLGMRSLNSRPGADAGGGVMLRLRFNPSVLGTVWLLDI